MNAANQHMTVEEYPASSRPTKQKLRVRLYAALFALDLGMILIGNLTAAALRSGGWPDPANANLALVVALMFAVFAINGRAYSLDTLMRPVEGVRRALLSLTLTVGAVLLIIFFVQAGAHVSRLAVAGGSLLSAGLIVIGRYGFHRVARHIVGRQPVDEVMIVDGVESGPPAEGVRVYNAAVLGLKPDLHDPMMLHRLGEVIAPFDRVVIACPPEQGRAWAALLKGANVHGEILVPQLLDFGAIGVREFHGNSTLAVSCGPLSLPRRAQKRVLDLAITIPLLIALSPVLAIVALAVKLDSPGTILFRQTRLGRGNRLFHVYKFRSMRADRCDALGTVSTQRDDDRVTRVGRVLRATSIDELPQLFNVLIGNMSLVGPRPHALGSTAGEKLFWDVDQRYWHRHAIKPGITGLAQVRGHRGATHETVHLINRLEADLEYLKGWTVFRDLMILVATLRVISHRNAY